MIVLVGYASKYGSTQGIAERIAARLEDHGIHAEVRPMDSHQDTSAYDAVVLGSAIHDGGWLPEAVAFVRQGLDALAARPLWLFSVSTLGEQSSAFPSAVARWMRRMRKEPKGIAAFYSSVHPRDHHYFAGAVEREHWPLAGRLFMKVIGGRYGDHRNWQEIDAWAEGIARSLVAGDQGPEHQPQ